MIGSQGHLNVWEVPRVQYENIQESFKMNQFPNLP